MSHQQDTEYTRTGGFLHFFRAAFTLIKKLCPIVFYSVIHGLIGCPVPKHKKDWKTSRIEPSAYYYLCSCGHQHRLLIPQKESEKGS